MALPPKGDPRRPLHLAARSMRILAVLLFVIFGLSALASFFIGRTRTIIIVEAIAAVIYGAPAVANLVLAIYSKQGHHWAIIAALVLAGIELLIMVLAAIGTTLGGMMGHPNVGGAIITWIIVLALGQLLLHLVQALRAFHKMQADDQRGFEVLGLQQLQPMPLPEQQSLPDVAV